MLVPWTQGLPRPPPSSLTALPCVQITPASRRLTYITPPAAPSPRSSAQPARHPAPAATENPYHSL
ncbi:uncharacterized protein SCHCODRAFT_02639186 [Schizophyllum commune H4-8]|uniref:uncharacterized protein n=1 Tax=Schizophyllum commune (strain H4-8 / FGSC 9210) TaxID=578458 RepID=UPI0021608ADB|nr:uncharacterized protein SCHCODRAFT_02639186 [Schizophyllum commune H4-8]KAI5887903.1 hypothetical protein SCHCODRAFT_02639186 [Schizophyllum commune H4-8]